MPQYRLHLHDGPTRPSETRYIDLPSNEEALELARDTLIDNEQFSRAVVWTDDRIVVVFERGGDRP